MPNKPSSLQFRTVPRAKKGRLGGILSRKGSLAGKKKAGQTRHDAREILDAAQRPAKKESG